MNKYRLASNLYYRETEENKTQPKKVYFLSLEGTKTEKEYFEGVKANKKSIGINGDISIEILRKSDTNSSPQAVLELLEEYLVLRNNSIEKELFEILLEKYNEEKIKNYIYKPKSLTKEEFEDINLELQKIGYDYQYRKYLKKYDKEFDEFCIVIDRDSDSNTKENLQEIYNMCKEKGYKMCLSNPCFEFWLLLHFSDIKNEYSDMLDKIKTNETISCKHTFVSKELSKKARHTKKQIKFNINYLKRIDNAINNAEQFSTKVQDIINDIGTNIGELIIDMRNS